MISESTFTELLRQVKAIEERIARTEIIESPIAGGTGPITAMMFHYAAKVTAGSAKTYIHDPAQDFAYIQYQEPPANLDTFTQGFIIAAGTYTFRVLGVTFPNRGIIDWTVDGISIVAGQDWYSAALANNVIKSTAGVVLTAGAHVLQGKLNGKNASSSNYYMSLTAYWFE